MMRNIDLEMVAVILLLAFSFHGEAGVGSSGLSFNFYDESCPQLENIVRAGVGSLFLADPTTPAALLRLMFHDCQVQVHTMCVFVSMWGFLCLFTLQELEDCLYLSALGLLRCLHTLSLCVLLILG